MSFGVAVLTASVLFVVFNAMQGDAHWLVASVIIIEIAVVAWGLISKPANLSTASHCVKSWPIVH